MDPQSLSWTADPKGSVRYDCHSALHCTVHWIYCTAKLWFGSSGSSLAQGGSSLALGTQLTLWDVVLWLIDWREWKLEADRYCTVWWTWKWARIFVLFVCFVFSSFLRFWLTGWLTDRLTYILPCWLSFFLFHFLFANSFLFSEATHVLTYPPTYLSFCWSPRSIHVLAHRYSYMPSPPYYMFIHLHSHCCLSFHHILFSSVPCFLVTLYARYLRRSTTNTPSALGCLKKKSLTDFAANPPFYRWTLRFGCFWKQISATQDHPYPPVKSKYFNGISTRVWLSSPLLRCIGWRVLVAALVELWNYALTRDIHIRSCVETQGDHPAALEGRPHQGDSPHQCSGKGVAPLEQRHRCLETGGSRSTRGSPRVSIHGNPSVDAGWQLDLSQAPRASPAGGQLGRRQWGSCSKPGSSPSSRRSSRIKITGRRAEQAAQKEARAKLLPGEIHNWQGGEQKGKTKKGGKGKGKNKGGWQGYQGGSAEGDATKQKEKIPEKWALLKASHLPRRHQPCSWGNKASQLSRRHQPCSWEYKVSLLPRLHLPQPGVQDMGGVAPSQQMSFLDSLAQCDCFKRTGVVLCWWVLAG